MDTSDARHKNRWVGNVEQLVTCHGQYLRYKTHVLESLVTDAVSICSIWLANLGLIGGPPLSSKRGTRILGEGFWIA